MSIFRESFPDFIKEELTRRQDGMLLRNPNFVHQLNSRSAWVRMSSGVNVNNSSELAKKYVLQGGVLNNSTSTVGDKIVDNFALKAGLGSGGTAYDNLSPGGNKNRLGIRPMPGITNLSIQSKSAYGSLQEATVSFTAWDIRQLEELEILYMRPGYTVLLEFGWNYAKINGALPSYDILNSPPKSLNDAFKGIHSLITNSSGNYDALIGYVKNYNWSAREDGGYDCTTTIISLGEILESLKCNWVPMNTKALDSSGKGILNIPDSSRDNVVESYKKGMIPGLLQEIYNYTSTKNDKNITNFVIKDTPNPDGSINYYDILKLNVKNSQKNNRGGLTKILGKGSDYEYFITLKSFCDLLNKHVLISDDKKNPLIQITTNEQNQEGELTKDLLKCISSPYSLSTNLGICYIQNDSWNNLKINVKTDQTQTSVSLKPISKDIKVFIESKSSGYNTGVHPINIFQRFGGNIQRHDIQSGITRALGNTALMGSVLIPGQTEYTFNGNLQSTITELSVDLVNSLKKADYTIQGNNLIPVFTFYDGTSFKSNTNFDNTNSITVDFSSYFGSNIEFIYNGLFIYDYNKNGGINLTKHTGAVEDPFLNGDSKLVKDNTGKLWDKQSVLNALTLALTKARITPELQATLNEDIPKIAEQISNIAGVNINDNAKQFLVPSSLNSKQLGNIGNIYINLNFLYEQAVSKNMASNDTQNKNNISILSYLQGILRETQNSLGNINSFDIQVDSRNAVGRIIDINYTGNPGQDKEPFTLQIHNLNSVVRNYKFSSKIFPEMGSIIAISAQDPEGVATLGYDNATLVAWNEGISDRIIPKKITPDSLPNSNIETTYILPFLTQMWEYFKTLQGKGKDDNTLIYGGLNFAFRDFLANIDKFDGRNKFKTIIPTELNITMDGLGGFIIGNLFQINQDIVPKGYKNVGGRKMAYIVAGLSHNITDNDWTTDIKAYPIVFEQAIGKDISKNWNNNKYPSSGDTVIGNATISFASTKHINPVNIKKAVQFFLKKGYTDFQTAALVGGFIQESRLMPDITNGIGAIGIAQWLGDRKINLQSKPNYKNIDTQLSFIIEELNTSSSGSNKKLKTSSTLEDAIAAAASYERFGGITKGTNTTYQDVLQASETGNRIGFTKDLLERIQNGEFN
jgi:hypothetical protein